MRVMIDVTCAIIRNEDDEVLVVQRGEKSDHPYRWEFPGGKVHKGETLEECIIREIAEELSTDIIICGNLDPVEYDYGYKQIRLFPFVCDTLDELPVLTEHEAFKWVNPEILLDVDFCEADVLVARKYLEGFTKDTSEKPVTPPINKADIGQDDIQLREMIDAIMSMEQADWVATSAMENPVIFAKLLEFSHSDDKKIAFHASWILTKVGDRDPGMFEQYYHSLITSLKEIDNESVERSFLRILSLADPVKFDEKHRGLLADYCFAALSAAESAIAVKAYAMEILYNLSVIYPQLGNELAASIRILLEDGSAGIVSKGNTILKKITKISLD